MQLDDAIVGALRASSAVTSLLANGALGVAHQLLPPGTLPPYIRVRDVPGSVSYTFTDNIAWAEDLYIIDVFTQDTPSASAQEAAKAIKDAYFAALQDPAFTVSGNVVLLARWSGRSGSGWEEIDEENSYFRDSDRWIFQTGPA